MNDMIYLILLFICDFVGCLFGGFLGWFIAHKLFKGK